MNLNNFPDEASIPIYFEGHKLPLEAYFMHYYIEDCCIAIPPCKNFFRKLHFAGSYAETCSAWRVWLACIIFFVEMQIMRPKEWQIWWLADAELNLNSVKKSWRSVLLILLKNSIFKECNWKRQYVSAASVELAKEFSKLINQKTLHKKN